MINFCLDNVQANVVHAVAQTEIRIRVAKVK